MSKKELNIGEESNIKLHKDWNFLSIFIILVPRQQ